MQFIKESWLIRRYFERKAKKKKKKTVDEEESDGSVEDEEFDQFLGQSILFAILGSECFTKWLAGVWTQQGHKGHKGCEEVSPTTPEYKLLKQIRLQQVVFECPTT